MAIVAELHRMITASGDTVPRVGVSDWWRINTTSVDGQHLAVLGLATQLVLRIAMHDDTR